MKIIFYNFLILTAIGSLSHGAAAPALDAEQTYYLQKKKLEQSQSEFKEKIRDTNFKVRSIRWTEPTENNLDGSLLIYNVRIKRLFFGKKVYDTESQTFSFGITTHFDLNFHGRNRYTASKGTRTYPDRLMVTRECETTEI